MRMRSLLLQMPMRLKAVRKYLEATLGIFCQVIAFDLFISPLKIAVGGTSGIAVLLKQVFGIDQSLFIAVFFIAMIIVNYFVFGKNDTVKLLYCSVMYPILIKVFENIPYYIHLNYNDKFILLIFAGIIYGIGNGLIFKNGFLCGGTDIPKKIMSTKLKIQMGKCILFFDGIIIAFGAFVFGIRSALYAIIIIYIASTISDKIMLGISNRKMFYIMTSKPEEVRECIKNEFKRGITEIDVIGGYDEKKHHMLMCAIYTKDYLKLKKRITEIDDKSFFIIMDAYYTYHGGEISGTN